MKTLFPRIAIVLTATTWAGFAIWLGTNPSALLATFGIENSPPEMLTELRAFYGGVEMAIATAMLILWRRGDLFASLLIGGLPLLGAACGRCLGMIVDGYSNLHVIIASVELAGAGLCWAGCLALGKTTRPNR